jgi:hypothetical protein
MDYPDPADAVSEQLTADDEIWQDKGPRPPWLRAAEVARRVTGPGARGSFARSTSASRARTFPW